MDKQTAIEKLLEKYIRQDRWGIHERLPSERELAEEFGASRNTVRFALRALSGRKVLRSRRGSETFVVMIPQKKCRATPRCFCWSCGSKDSASSCLK